MADIEKTVAQYAEAARVSGFMDCIILTGRILNAEPGISRADLLRQLEKAATAMPGHYLNNGKPQ